MWATRQVTPANYGFSAGYVLKVKAEEIIDTMPGRLFGARYILGKKVL